MRNRHRKVKKMRGSKTHGYGSKKKHRGGGSRGGRGRAGITKHKKLMFLKRGVSVGKRGFVSVGQRKGIAKHFINIKELSVLAEGKKEVDLTSLGYEKVLGGGSITFPLTVKAKEFSEKAREKIEAAGGKAISEGAGQDSGEEGKTD